MKGSHFLPSLPFNVPMLHHLLALVITRILSTSTIVIHNITSTIGQRFRVSRPAFDLLIIMNVESIVFH